MKRIANGNGRFGAAALILAAGLIVTLAGGVQGQSTTADRIQKLTYDFTEAGAAEMEYALFVPSNYDASRATPLVVLLHGLGSNPGQVIRYQGITDEAEKHGYIVAAPYGFNAHGWYGSRGDGKDFARRYNRDGNGNDPDNLGELSEKDVLNVLALVRDKFNVDEDRTYLMGHSMGGGGTWHIGSKHSEIWAALGPMSPAIYSNPDDMDNLVDLKVIVVQGDKDRLVPVATARRWVAKMKELGTVHEYIEIAEGNHVSSITQNPEMIGKVFAFFNTHARGSDAGAAVPLAAGAGSED